jgi:hypothetical protein
MKLFQAIITITPLIISTDAARYLRRQLQEDDNTITFPEPTHHGKLVDYCLTFKQDCGKPAGEYLYLSLYGDILSMNVLVMPILTLNYFLTLSLQLIGIAPRRTSVRL